MSGQAVTDIADCNNRNDCASGQDEAYCQNAPEQEDEYFNCHYGKIPKSMVCDMKCDCKNYCDDEWKCNGLIYHKMIHSKCDHFERNITSYDICKFKKDCNTGNINCNQTPTCIREVYPTRSYIISNNSRCLPWAFCANKLDQTNCTDVTLAPLQCSINGMVSTVSLYVICKISVVTVFNWPHSNRTAVCDQEEDMWCATPTFDSDCLIHKHQLCNNISDCRDASDEAMSLCYRLTSRSCRRKYFFNISLRFPVEWIGDGVDDCINGIDEVTEEWHRCQYKINGFTIYGVEQCQDVYICPSGRPLYVDVHSLCDEPRFCQGNHQICTTSNSAHYSGDTILMKDINYMFHCLPGLTNLQNQIVHCQKISYPMVEILGAQANSLYVPTTKVSCKYVYGEEYRIP